MTNLEKAVVEARLTGHALSSLQGELRRFRNGQSLRAEKTKTDTYTGEIPSDTEDQASELARQSERNRKNVDGIRMSIEAMSKEREAVRNAVRWMK